MRRILLLFSFLPVLLWYPGYSWMYHWAFLIPLVSFTVWVWLFNFKKIVVILHQRPIYFDDLELPHTVPHRERFQHIFIMILTVTIALLIGLIVDFQISTWRQNTLGWYQILGIIGGVWNIVDKFEGYIGNTLLLALNYVRVHSPPMRGMTEEELTEIRIDSTFTLE